ncbi:hypothetical protein MTP99_014029 [Tenebrio molitor]|nr:hypothetical protein MTP99_014029 [Tenebrio molitor]
MIFESMVVSMLMYGAEIWGWKEQEEVERVQEKYLRWVLLRPKGAGHKQTPFVRIGERNRRVRFRSAGTKQHLFVLLQGRLARFRHLAGCGTVVYRSLLARYLRSWFGWSSGSESGLRRTLQGFGGARPLLGHLGAQWCLHEVVRS